MNFHILATNLYLTTTGRPPLKTSECSELHAHLGSERNFLQLDQQSALVKISELK